MTKLMKDVFESKEDGTIKAIGFPTYWSDERCIAAYQAINTHDTLTEQNKQLVEALTDISNMCVGEIAMGYKLDAQSIGEIICKATGKTNPELNEVVAKHKEQI